MLLKPKPCAVSLPKPAIGFHFNSVALAACLNAPRYIEVFQEFEKVFIPFMTYQRDQALMQQLAIFVDRARVLPYLDPRAVLDLIGNLDFLVCSGLHAAIFAYVSQVPFIVFPYHEKVEAFMRERALERWMFRDAADMGRKLQELIESPPDYTSSLREDAGSLRDHMKRVRDELEHTARSRQITTQTRTEDITHRGKNLFTTIHSNPYLSTFLHILLQQGSIPISRKLSGRRRSAFASFETAAVGTARWIASEIAAARSTWALLAALLFSAVGRILDRPLSVLTRATLRRSVRHESEVQHGHTS
jgi:hypothetical protein